ncbi:S-methyl-5-thioribose-1-phosphate isomerase [Bifidobacterium psychraerophilum]|uniref:S-methyl-5-thioribose-1-phosphate isomerase n=1 Tax=Bifidobacterium psychraerophilum TaxID=218140 RepID=UPI0039EABF8A
MSTQLLNEETVLDYISGRDDLNAVVDVRKATVREVGDGNLNLLFLVQDGTHGLAIKQTLPYVRSDHSWKVTEDSIFAEARGLDAASRYAGAYAPEYYGLDAERRLIVEEDLSDWQVWRPALSAGKITPLAARDTGRFVAELAYHTSYFGQSEQDVQRAAAQAANPELEQITEDLIFTEPYYEHVHNSWDANVDDAVSALRNDEVRTQVAKLKYEFLTNGEALIHGDLHTNSIFVRDDGRDAAQTPDEGAHVKIFDYEFGFYGPVAFDIGILWGNFLIAQAREFATLPADRRHAGAEGEFLEWLLSLYEESWRGFEGEFRRLATHTSNRIFTEDFVNQWIARTLRHAVGFAGAEGVRRTIGWAKVSDIETLEGEEKDRAVRIVLAASRRLLEGFEHIASASDVAAIVRDTAASIQVRSSDGALSDGPGIPGSGKSPQARPSEALRSLRWVDTDQGGALRIIDQRRLPASLEYRNLTTVDEVIESIRTLAVRGANSIGAAGAFAYGFAVRDGIAADEAFDKVVGARPTAVTLRHGVQLAAERYEKNGDWRDALRAGDDIIAADADECRRIGEIGSRELADATNILTHCNTGILATAGIGTALGVIYTKHAKGQKVHAYSTETRPLRQGLRLTAWELGRNGVDVTALVDGAGPAALHQGIIDAVIVGADRIAVNGDTANKIGTYSLAVAAKENGIPFYIAAPLSAIDRNAASAEDIPVEFRSGEEVLDAPGVNQNLDTWNPAFDVTPAKLISGIITPEGVLRPPFVDSIAKVLAPGTARSGDGDRA